MYIYIYIYIYLFEELRWVLNQPTIDISPGQVPETPEKEPEKTTSHRDSVVEATTLVGLSRENVGFNEQNCDLTHKSLVFSSQNEDFGWNEAVGNKRYWV